MDSKINKLRNEHDKILNDIEKIADARDILIKHGILCHVKSCNEIILGLMSKSHELEVKILKHVNKCNHEFFRPYIYEPGILECSKCGDVFFDD